MSLAQRGHGDQTDATMRALGVGGVTVATGNAHRKPYALDAKRREPYTFASRTP